MGKDGGNKEDDEMDMGGALNKTANSVLLIAFSRIAMVLSLPTIALISTLGANWLDQKFTNYDTKIEFVRNELNAKIDAQKTAAENEARIAVSRIERADSAARIALENATKINDRLIQVETKLTQQSADSAKFQDAVAQRLDRLQDSVVSLSNAVAALTATIQASGLTDRSRFNQPRRTFDLNREAEASVPPRNN